MAVCPAMLCRLCPVTALSHAMLAMSKEDNRLPICPSSICCSLAWPGNNVEYLESLRHMTLQALYSYTTTSSAANAPADRPAAAAALSMMPELHVEGFDAEQIWLQLDMASAQLVRRARRLLKKAGSEPTLLTPETEEDLSGQHAALFTVPRGIQNSKCMRFW